MNQYELYINQHNNDVSRSVVPKYSDLRQEEILRISDDLSPLFDKNTPQVSEGKVLTIATKIKHSYFSSGVETSTLCLEGTTQTMNGKRL